MDAEGSVGPRPILFLGQMKPVHTLLTDFRMCVLILSTPMSFFWVFFRPKNKPRPIIFTFSPFFIHNLYSIGRCLTHAFNRTLLNKGIISSLGRYVTLSRSLVCVGLCFKISLLGSFQDKLQLCFLPRSPNRMLINCEGFLLGSDVFKPPWHYYLLSILAVSIIFKKLCIFELFIWISFCYFPQELLSVLNL